MPIWIGAAFLVLLGGGRAAVAVDQTLIPTGSVWRYRDGGQSPGAGWTAPSYDDSAWASGPAQLGYGDGDEATVVSYGGNPAAKAITTWFRRSFSVSGAAAFHSLRTRLLCDDGAVVYLNGVELRRDNLPAGPIGEATLAPVAIGGAAESAFTVDTADASALHDGVNVIAVEVHQANATSSDISFDLELIASSTTVSVTRGPYLQLGTSTGIVVRWRTDTPTDSRVSYGLAPDALGQVAGSAALTTEHVVALAGLSPDTIYHYAVGSSAGVLAGGDGNHHFRTLVAPGSASATRLWVVGDTGTGGAGAPAVLDAYLDFAAGEAPDLWLMLGDNAYTSGTDAEYQHGLFDVYPSLLTRSVLWPTLGNHDGISADSATQSGPYYDGFTLPTAAEAGGIASGTEAYYAFDVGNVHVICLESYETSRAANGPMLTWLAADLAANHADWTIAFWHHPPYSKGSHDSDTEIELMEMRQNVLPVLEAGGVDLVLSGHSHAYERSVLLDGHYGLSTTLKASMIRDGGDGAVEGDGAYAKPANGAHNGTVYVVEGTGAQLGGGSLNHPVMKRSLAVLGSLVLDVVGHTLSGRFLSDTGVVRDAFTITKGAVAAQTASGTVHYYRGAGGAVGGVLLTAKQSSGVGGAYAVNAPTGAPLALRPRRIGGVGGAVSALDAAWVLQSIAGLRPFDAMQTRACDVTGNGSLSTLDASTILQRVVGTIDQLPIVGLCGSEFAFQPTAAAPISGRLLPLQASNGTCQPGAIELEPMLAGVGGLDFSAAAFGDCTGNWSQSPALTRRTGAPRVRVGRAQATADGWRLRLAVRARQPISALELALKPETRLVTIRALGAAGGALVRVDPSGHRAALASARPLAKLDLELRGDGPTPTIAGASVDEEPAMIE